MSREMLKLVRWQTRGSKLCGWDARRRWSLRAQFSIIHFIRRVNFSIAAPEGFDLIKEKAV